MPLHGEIIVIKRNGTDGTHFPLTATSCLFGRKTECDIRIQLPHVSKEHCKVEVKGKGEVFITNLSSVNPTQLNGNTVKQPVRLKHGDVITIIDRSFRFEKSPAQQGKRRSAGLDSETFKVFASNQSSDTNETVRIETLTNKTQRKSEGNISKTSHSRRSLQISSSSEAKNSLSPFGELYEMLKSEVGSQKQNGKTPVKVESGTPKIAALKRSLQNQDHSQLSVAPKRISRSQSSESPVTSPKELVEPRSASAGRMRAASKSPSRSPKTSKALNGSFEAESAQEPEQTTRRSSSKRNSQSVPQEEIAPSVNGEPENSGTASDEQGQVITQERSTPKNAKTPGSKTPHRRSNQSVPEQPVLENQKSSPQGKSPRGRRRASLDKSPKSAPKTSEAQPRQSPRKRRSDELSLPDPPAKRKRVSFGGHLSPELFDKRLPPNSPLKKGATPARRSLSLNSPRIVMRKSYGLKQSVIREVFEQSNSSSVGPKTPTRLSHSSPARSSSVKSSPTVMKGEKSQTKSPTKPSASVKSPKVSQTSDVVTPVKNSVTGKSPVKTPSTSSTKITPFKRSPSVKSPVKSPSKSPKKTPVKSSKGLSLSTASIKTPGKRSPVAKIPSPGKRSPVAKTPSPGKRSPVAKTPSPGKRSPVAKTPTPGKRSPVAKTPTPGKRSPVAKTPTPGKRSLVAKTPTLLKRSPVAKTPTPGKRSPVAKTPSLGKRSPVAKTPSPGKRSPVAKTPTPIKRSPVAKTPTPGKRSPVAKTPTPGKRSPVAKTPTPGKRSPVAKTPTPGKRSPVAKTPTPGKRSPVAKTPTLLKRSPVAKTPTPGKRSPVAKTPTPGKRSPVAKTPTPATPSTPYVKGRFSVSRINTPPQEQDPSELKASKTPYKSRKSLSMKKTPRRSRKLEAFELIRSRRRSGATEANLLVSRTWADVVKIGVARTQQKIDKPVRKVAATKKKLKLKTPVKKIKHLTSTGHVDSPATILVGRAHTRVVNLTGYVPKVVTNQAVKHDSAHNESFTGVAELFSTPANKQRKSNRLESSKTDSPSSVVVEMSVMQTPEESGEMVVSPLNSSTTTTTRRKQYSQDAVSRLLQSPASPDLRKVGNAAHGLTEETPKSQKDERKSVGLSGVKRVMRTPKQKGTPVTDPHALRKLLRTPKEKESPRSYSRKSTNLEVLDIDKLVKTPKQKGVPVADFSGLQRIMKTPKQRVEPVKDLVGVKRLMKTPKQKAEPVEDMIGVKRIMRTPKEKSQPVEDMVGIKRIMRTPKERGQPVEDMMGIKRLMRTPKEKGQPVDEIALNHLMSTPIESVQSTESTRPIEEIFGIRNLIKTPPKSFLSKEVTDPSGRSAKSLGNASVPRGRSAKRLSLLADTPPGNDGHKTVQSTIVQEAVTQINEEVVKSTQKRGRPSKSQNVSSDPKDHVSDGEVTSRRRGRPSSTSKESLSDAEVTSPARLGRPKIMVENINISLIEGKVTSPAPKAKPSKPVETPKESVPDASSDVTSPRRRGRPSSITKASKDSLSDAEVTSPVRLGRPKTMAENTNISLIEGNVPSPAPKAKPSNPAEAPKESVADANSEVTSPRRRGRPSSTAKAPKESLSTSQAKVTTPGQHERSKVMTENSELAPIADGKVISPTRKTRASTPSEAPETSVADAGSEVTSPRRRGRPSSTGKALKESLSVSDAKVASPRQKGRPSSVSPSESTVVSEGRIVSPITATSYSGEVVSPRRRGRPSSTGKNPKDSLPEPDTEVASPRQKGRPSSVLPNEPTVEADGEIASPKSHKRFGSKEVVPGESTSTANSNTGDVVSPRRRGRPSSTDNAALNAQVTSPVQRGRSKAVSERHLASVSIADKKLISPGKGSGSTDEVTKESEVVSVVISPSRRGRRSTSIPLTSPTPKAGHGTTTELLKEPLIVSEVISPVQRGRPRKSMLTSPTHNEKPSTLPEVSKETIPDVVKEVTSPKEIGRDPILVSETKTISQTHRGKTKTKVNMPQEPSGAPEVQVTRGRSSKGTAELSLSMANELSTTQTRRGRPKASAQVAKISALVAEEDAKSPTRGSRSKSIAEATNGSVPVLNDLAIPQKRRGRAKVTDVSKEPVSIVSEAAAAVPTTRVSRSKDTADVTVESVLEVQELTSQKRKGRPRKADEPKESAVFEVASMEEVKPEDADVSDKVASPTRKGRSRNAEVSTVSDNVTLPKRRRKPETNEGELEPSQRLSVEVNEKIAKSTKKSVRQNKSSKHNADELQEPEPTIAAVIEKKTQLPLPRGRKATQSDLVASEENPKSSSEDEQLEVSTVKTLPVARRGGRRRNAEESSSIEDVAKPEPSKREAKSRGRAKSKETEVVEENADLTVPIEPAKSPEPKSPKRSRQTKDLVTEPPIEIQPKSLRGRANKRKDNSPEATDLAGSEMVVAETEQIQEAKPARGKRRTARDLSNVSVSDDNEQTKGPNAKPQRGSRRNQTLEDSNASHKTSDGVESHSVPEGQKVAKNTRGRILKNIDEQAIPKSKTKSVQWHPLVATDAESTIDKIAQESNEASHRGSRSKGKTRPDTPELKVPAKRSRRGNSQAEAEEPQASTSLEPETVTDVMARKRGRKANVDAKPTESSDSTEAVHTSPQRGRRGASKIVDSENNELNVEPSTSRRQRGVVATKTPTETEKTQSPVKSRGRKVGSGKEEENLAKSTKGVKRKLPSAEAKRAILGEPETLQANESVLVETENIPAGRGRKNQRNAKVQKAEETPLEKPAMSPESPAKRRKTEAAATAVQKKSSRLQTSKLENEKPSSASKTRASTRSRK